MSRLTVAQAIVRFLGAQWIERDGQANRFFAGSWGIFGHGNVAGIGQALLESATGKGAGAPIVYRQGRNEQAMVHASVAYARHRDRLAAYAVTSSIGPGATNMITGAALATINRIPVLLLPGDIFATRVADPVLQELESPSGMDVSVNDGLRPVSRYWDRINRPEQLGPALLAAMRVLTDPAETGAVTLSLPQDVQAEAYDWPEELFEERVWRIARPVPEPDAVHRAAEAIRSAERPLIVAGGGVLYSGADAVLRRFAEASGIPVAETQAGKGTMPYDHPQAVGAVGATGTTAADALAEGADVVIGVGTRYSDFTTASRTVFAHDRVRFVNLNVASFDAHKLAAIPLIADARRGLTALAESLEGWKADAAYTARATGLARDWDEAVQLAYDGDEAHGVGGPPTQAQVIGAVNAESRPQDVVLCAAGSMPGELHRLWRTRDRKGYHVEYGYSCMGYEIAGGLGAALAVRDAGEDRDVFVMVGDGSYLMMNSELVTAVQENAKIIVVLVQNHGFASIGALSESVGAERFGTAYRYRTPTGLDGATLPVDLAANAASLGVDVLPVRDVRDLRAALQKARRSPRSTLVHVETDPLVAAPESPAWWDVPVSEVSALSSTRDARRTYEKHKSAQRPYLRPSDDFTPPDPDEE